MCFVHFDLKMCFSLQRRAIFQHFNFKKGSETVSFFTILTLKYVSRYSVVQVFMALFEVVLCNTAPATQNYCDDWSALYMKGRFIMSRATGITIHLYQILHLARKMNAISDPRHIWNVISNARSK